MIKKDKILKPISPPNMTFHYNNMKKKLGFSLFEISIVLLVTSILLVGVSKGREVVTKFDVINAAKLTKSSVVNNIEDLSLWLETTSSDSLSHIEASDNNSISTWNDLSESSFIPKNATQINPANQPKYITNVINGLPVLRFDGSASLSFDGNILVQTNYTIFIVEQRRSDKDLNHIISGTDGIVDRVLRIGYRNDFETMFSQYTGNYDANVSTYTSPIPRIHAFLFTSNIGKKHFINGIHGTMDNPGSNYIVPLQGFVGSTIGANVFEGDIAEIIMFSRELKTQEREDVESYLSEKWGIDLQ
jgi:hypothetical protein